MSDVIKQKLTAMLASLRRGDKVRIVKMDHPLGTLIRSQPVEAYTAIVESLLEACEALEAWVVTTPTDVTGEFDPINEPQAWNAKAVLASIEKRLTEKK